MQEKDMMNDVISMLNSSITGYANVITQTENQQLRQEVQQMRNSCETSQYDFYNVAKQKGFYKPAEAATPQQIQSVKSQMNA
ncbi:spore coat protein [Clostridium botulinum]|nr:spore coat protein [Clostridium botulinum]